MFLSFWFLLSSLYVSLAPSSESISLLSTKLLLHARNSGNRGKFPVVKGETNSKESLCLTFLPAHTSAPAVHFGSEWGVHNLWLEDHSDSCWLCCLMCAWIQPTAFWGSRRWQRNWASIVLPWRQLLNAKEMFPEGPQTLWVPPLAPQQAWGLKWNKGSHSLWSNVALFKYCSVGLGLSIREFPGLLKCLWVTWHFLSDLAVGNP